ncbi:hypothetical protein ACTPEF_27290, partial [Clostridioides difficile]
KGPRLREGMVIAIEPMVNAGRYHVKTLSDGWTTVTIDGKKSAINTYSLLIILTTKNKFPLSRPNETLTT